MCALVCRAWLPRSRAKLFEDIHINNSRTYNLLVDRVVHSETMSLYLAPVNSLHLDPQLTSDQRSEAFLRTRRSSLSS
ncbi:hypothetical protein L226DRAFT_396460 [Lentinus tigrinus ALCF2SS1-7]|nr:hypothetical protein L226DRAFT_396460 [Lentinus tigrinus ALCF2SS1-7]